MKTNQMYFSRPVLHVRLYESEFIDIYLDLRMRKYLLSLNCCRVVSNYIAFPVNFVICTVLCFAQKGHCMLLSLSLSFAVLYLHACIHSVFIMCSLQRA